MVLIYYALALVILLIDQLSKWLVVRQMVVGESITVIPGFFYLTSIRNNGAAWSILEGQLVFFFLITVIVLVAVIYYLHKIGRRQPLLGVSFGFIIGGALGNFLDRLFRGEVVDFIHVYIIRYSFPVFNVADSALCIGAVLLILYMLSGKRAE